MPKLLTALLATLLLGTAAQADDKHHPPEAAKPAPAKPAAAAAPADQRFAAAYERMKKMMAQMDRIKATKDPQERARLMREHMDSLHEGMQALRPAGGGMMQMMGCQMMAPEPGKAGAPGCPMMGGQAGKPGPGPGERMDMMEKRMDMMQMMMEQMVEREGQKPQPKQE